MRNLLTIPLSLDKWYWDANGYWSCPNCAYPHDFLPGNFRCYHCNQLFEHPSDFDVMLADEFQKDMKL